MITMITDKYANRILGTDVVPFEIVKVISDKTVVVRSMNTEKEDWDMDVKLGGFAAHVANQRDQKWKITSDPDGYEFRIRKAKDGKWYSAGKGMKFVLSDEPEYFYDYNF